MLAIVGILVVIGAVVGGYLMEHGHLAVLFQPAELVIIGGAALGSLLIANPLATIRRIFKGLAQVIKGTPYDRAFYLETLKMLNALFHSARKNGATKLESDIEDPEQSDIFKQYPKFLKNHHAVHFLCDTIRMSISGGVEPFQLDQLMESDMEVHHHEAGESVSALTSVADSLPGLGIVAAVLGVVITMGALGGPPEEIGHKVAAALVGTFLGILMCYGFLGPLASAMAKLNEAENHYLNVLRVGTIAYLNGNAPILAAEFARRVIPQEYRPTFKEMEDACRGGAGAGSGSAKEAA
jgi:chemotaxis protein MotA